MRPRLGAILLAALLAPAFAGCSREIDTSYGRRAGPSVNGTGVFAELVRGRGHTVRTAIRLNEGLEEWADAIVRFAPQPGPVGHDEAQWYDGWLTSAPGRRLIYVPHDYEAQHDYWNGVIASLPKSTPQETVARIETRRDAAAKWPSQLPPTLHQKSDPDAWFAVEPPLAPPATCKTLGGPWAVGIDAARAAIPVREALKAEFETVLLTGDGHPLAIEWTRPGGSKVLVVASGAFLLNAATANPARRPLAMHAARWLGDEPRRVAFVEGWVGTGPAAGPPSVFAILRVPPFGWVAGQLLVLGLAACLARAPRLGRPRPEPPSAAGRPAAHPQALGALLAKTGQAEEARAILRDYRRWRGQAAPPRRGAAETGVAPSQPAAPPIE